MPEQTKKKKFELPHVYTIAFMLIILFAVLTWIIPSGQFERQTISTAAGTRRRRGRHLRGGIQGG